MWLERQGADGRWQRQGVMFVQCCQWCCAGHFWSDVLNSGVNVNRA